MSVSTASTVTSTPRPAPMRPRVKAPPRRKAGLRPCPRRHLPSNPLWRLPRPRRNPPRNRLPRSRSPILHRLPPRNPRLCRRRNPPRCRPLYLPKPPRRHRHRNLPRRHRPLPAKPPVPKLRRKVFRTAAHPDKNHPRLSLPEKRGWFCSVWLRFMVRSLASVTRSTYWLIRSLSPHQKSQRLALAAAGAFGVGAQAGDGGQFALLPRAGSPRR